PSYSIRRFRGTVNMTPGEILTRFAPQASEKRPQFPDRFPLQIGGPGREILSFGQKTGGMLLGQSSRRSHERHGSHEKDAENPRDRAEPGHARPRGSVSRPGPTGDL